MSKEDKMKHALVSIYNGLFLNFSVPEGIRADIQDIIQEALEMTSTQILKQSEESHEQENP